MNCLWFEVIDYNHYCWTMLIERFMVVLFSLELHLLRLNRVWTDISLFLKKKSICLYLGASHIGHPPILRKQFLLDLALIINLNWYFYSNQNEISQNKCCIVFFSTIQISVKLVSFVMLLCYMENILTNFQTMFLFADLDFSVFSVWSPFTKVWLTTIFSLRSELLILLFLSIFLMCYLTSVLPFKM